MIGCQHQANKDTCQICRRNAQQWEIIIKYAKEKNITPYQAMCEIINHNSQFISTLKSIF